MQREIDKLKVNVFNEKQVMTSLANMTRMFSSFESNIVSVERINEYCNVEHEVNFLDFIGKKILIICGLKIGKNSRPIGSWQAMMQARTGPLMDASNSETTQSSIETISTLYSRISLV
jgi:hypothetical protein